MKSLFVLITAIFYTCTSQAGLLKPLDFDEMYAVASSGQIGALKTAVRRGLNIDTTNQDGDTGLCLAIKRWDYRAYNAFRSAGAAPQTPCTINIPREHYEDFMSSFHIKDFFRYELKAWKL